MSGLTKKDSLHAISNESLFTFLMAINFLGRLHTMESQAWMISVIAITCLIIGILVYCICRAHRIRNKYRNANLHRNAEGELVDDVLLEEEVGLRRIEGTSSQELLPRPHHGGVGSCDDPPPFLF